MTEIQSLARGLKILEILSRADQGTGITDLAAELGVDKASASRLVSTLALYGFAEKDAATRRFHLGPRLVHLGRAVLDRSSLRALAGPYLRTLMQETGECAHLAILAQGQALYIDQVESPATLRVNAQVGTLNPLHCTALGKVLLAWSGIPIPSRLEAYTPGTITSPRLLDEHLGQVKQQGFALDIEEMDPGVCCIAAPIFDWLGDLAGAMGISGPSTRLLPEKMPALSATVQEVCHALSTRLAFEKQE